MAAILVFTMASVLLFTMVTSASRMNKLAKESDQAIFSELQLAEKKNSAEVRPEDKGKMLNLKIGSADAASYRVDLYRSGEGALYSYSRSANN